MGGWDFFRWKRRREQKPAATTRPPSEESWNEDAPTAPAARRFRLEEGVVREVERAEPIEPRLPVLIDVESHVREAEERFAEDPVAALADLERLRDTHQPSPELLRALCLLYKRSGMTTHAIDAAREALPLCFRERQGILAARILEEIDADAHALGFDREQLVAIGGALAETSEWRVAFRALASWLMKEPDDDRVAAIILRLVDRLLDASQAGEDAWRMATFVSVVAESGVVRQQAHERAARAERGVSGVITQPARTNPGADPS